MRNVTTDFVHSLQDNVERIGKANLWEAWTVTCLTGNRGKPSKVSDKDCIVENKEHRSVSKTNNNKHK